MTLYAYIQNGSVLATVDQDTVPPEVPGFEIVEAPDGTTIGMVFADGAFGPAPAPVYSKEDLLSYANGKQWSLATGGYEVTVGGNALVFATDALSQGLITGKALRLQQANAPATVRWQFASGYEEISAADFLAVSIKIADFIQSTFDALQPVLASIAAGTITDPAGVDSAAWPSSRG
jgi:hypothetical protein